METIKIPLGYVTIIPKDEYNSSSTYNRLNLVTYKNNGIQGVYLAKQDEIQNIPPTNEEYWMKFFDTNDLI